MTQAATMVRASRTSAGLTMRALAARADVATSTIARIESGKVDPTVGMLARLLSAAGRELELGTHRGSGPEIADLADAWSRGPRGDRPDWTRLRAFLDQLARHPEQQGPATLRRPAPSGSAVLDALLAGIAEKICDDAGFPRPTWARAVPALPEPWATPGTPAMREAIAAATPRALAERGLSIDEASLWREPAALGV
ncbi:MAG: helix-turn-helix domain-containing protein [Dermatophilaceae bacterium]